MPGEGGGPGPEIASAVIKTAVESAIPKVALPIPESGAFNPVDLAQSTTTAATPEVPVGPVAPPLSEVTPDVIPQPANVVQFPTPRVESIPTQPVDQAPRPANVVEFPPRTAPPPEPEQEDPAYQTLIDQAEKAAADNITAREMAGEIIPPDKKQEIHENDLNMAAYAYASQHPDEAKAFAEKDPRIKAALEKIDAQKPQAPADTEKKPTPENEEIAALRKEVAELKKLMLELAEKQVAALQEQDPSKKKLLLEIIMELLKHLAISIATETPLDLTKKVVEQAKAA